MILEILEKNKIREAQKISDYLEKNEIYLTHSMINKFIELIYEFENSKNNIFYDELKNIELDNKKTKKDRGTELIEKITAMKMPLYFSALREFNKRVNKLKNKNINIKYPKELEGEEILFEIKLKNSKDVEKVLKSLNENKNIIEEMMSIFENGVWEE